MDDLFNFNMEETGYCTGTQKCLTRFGRAASFHDRKCHKRYSGCSALNVVGLQAECLMWRNLILPFSHALVKPGLGF